MFEVIKIVSLVENQKDNLLSYDRRRKQVETFQNIRNICSLNGRDFSRLE